MLALDGSRHRVVPCSYLSLLPYTPPRCDHRALHLVVAGRGGGGGDDWRPRSRVSSDVPHDSHTGAYRDEHPAQAGREFRSPQGHGPILRGRLPSKVVATVFCCSAR